MIDKICDRCGILNDLALEHSISMICTDSGSLRDGEHVKDIPIMLCPGCLEDVGQQLSEAVENIEIYGEAFGPGPDADED